MISYSTRRNLLLIFTALVVAFVRHYLDTRHYLWQSIWDFLGWWVVHYIAVFVAAAVAYVCIGETEKFFLGREKTSNVLSVDRAVFYITMVFLVSALLIFLVAKYPASDYYNPSDY